MASHFFTPMSLSHSLSLNLSLSSILKQGKRQLVFPHLALKLGGHSSTSTTSNNTFAFVLLFFLSFFLSRFGSPVDLSTFFVLLSPPHRSCPLTTVFTYCFIIYSYRCLSKDIGQNGKVLSLPVPSPTFSIMDTFRLSLCLKLVY